MYSDSDKSEDNNQKGPKLPAYKLRFTDMPNDLVEKAILCKYNVFIFLLPVNFAFW